MKSLFTVRVLSENEEKMTILLEDIKKLRYALEYSPRFEEAADCSRT